MKSNHLLAWAALTAAIGGFGVDPVLWPPVGTVLAAANNPVTANAGFAVITKANTVDAVANGQEALFPIPNG